MIATTRRHLLASLTLALGSVLTAHQATAATTVYAITENNFLINFDPTDAGDLISAFSIDAYDRSTNLDNFGVAVGIDRPSDYNTYPEQIIGLSNQYAVIDVPFDGSPITSANFDLNDFNNTQLLDGLSYGMDFDPSTGEVRIVTDTNKNYSGFNSTPGPDLFYAAGDVNDGEDPNIVSIAYSFEPNTRLFGIDAEQNQLVLIDPDTGEIGTIGDLGIGVTGYNSFDINQEDGLAYMTERDRIYVVDLQTGNATAPVFGNNLIGPGGFKIVAMTTVPEPTSLALLGLGGLLIARRRRG